MTVTPMKSAVVAGALAFGLAFAAPVASAIGIGLQPTTVEMSLKPGERQRQAISIVNVHQEKAISMTIGLADWSLDDDGEIILAAPGDLEKSGAMWAQYSPGFVTLEPGESEQIIVDIAAPARISDAGDYRFALLASTILPEERGGGSGVWRRYQLASLFYVTTGDAESRPEIVGSGVSVDEAGHAVVGLRIGNDGNAHARLNGDIEITVGDELTSLPVGNVVVLDGGTRNFRAPLNTPLADGAEITVKLTNSFAPQVDGAVKTLEPFPIAWTADDLLLPSGDLEGAVGIDAETGFETERAGSGTAMVTGAPVEGGLE